MTGEFFPLPLKMDGNMQDTRMENAWPNNVTQKMKRGGQQ